MFTYNYNVIGLLYKFYSYGTWIIMLLTQASKFIITFPTSFLQQVSHLSLGNLKKKGK